MATLVLQDLPPHILRRLQTQQTLENSDGGLDAVPVPAPVVLQASLEPVKALGAGAHPTQLTAAGTQPVSGVSVVEPVAPSASLGETTAAAATPTVAAVG